MAFYQDHNLWLGDAKGNNGIQLTTEGNEKKRIKFGIASWVYGEELRQSRRCGGLQTARRSRIIASMKARCRIISCR